MDIFSSGVFVGRSCNLFSKCGLISIPGGGPYLSMGKREKTPYFRDIFTFCVPVGSLVLLQGPYFLCFVQIHARSVNSVYSYENLSVCDYSNLFILPLLSQKKSINCIFGSLYGCPGSFFGPYLVKKIAHIALLPHGSQFGSFVAITCFLGVTFGQNLMGGGTKTF